MRRGRVRWTPLVVPSGHLRSRRRHRASYGLKPSRPCTAAPALRHARRSARHCGPRAPRRPARRATGCARWTGFCPPTGRPSWTANGAPCRWRAPSHAHAAAPRWGVNAEPADSAGTRRAPTPGYAASYASGVGRRGVRTWCSGAPGGTRTLAPPLRSLLLPPSMAPAEFLETYRWNRADRPRHVAAQTPVTPPVTPRPPRARPGRPPAPASPPDLYAPAHPAPTCCTPLYSGVFVHGERPTGRAAGS